MKKSIYHRKINSFVRREGRITKSQLQALSQLWCKYGITPAGDNILHLDSLFSEPAPLVLEIGFGMGDSLFEAAKHNPDKNFIGVEVYSPGIGALLNKIDSAELKNIKLVQYDAVEFLRKYLPDNCIDKLALLFPDPWPKKKHHKRRIVQNNFVELLVNKLKPQGFFHFATDWSDYSEHVLSIMQDNPNFINIAGDNVYVQAALWRGETKFEKRGVKLGHEIFDLVFQKI